MRKLQLKTCLLLVVALSGMCVAQNYHQDAGPPPETVAPQPTMKQAQEFFLKNIGLHGFPECYATSGGTDTLLVRMEGSQITILVTGASSADDSIHLKKSHVSTASLTDVVVSFEPQSDSSYIAKCKYPAKLLFKCKSGKCFEGRREYHSWYTHQNGELEKTDKDERTTSEADTIYLDDAAMGLRLLKAIQFYQQGLAPSPF